MCSSDLGPEVFSAGGHNSLAPRRTGCIYSRPRIVMHPAPRRAGRGPDAGSPAWPPRVDAVHRRTEVPLSRTDRLTLIARMLSGRRFSNQEELATALARAGVEATQATLSRDLRSLGVAKRSGPDGSSW